MDELAGSSFRSVDGSPRKIRRTGSWAGNDVGQKPIDLAQRTSLLASTRSWSAVVQPCARPSAQGHACMCRMAGAGAELSPRTVQHATRRIIITARRRRPKNAQGNAGHQGGCAQTRPFAEVQRDLALGMELPDNGVVAEYLRAVDAPVHGATDQECGCHQRREQGRK